MNMTWCAVSTMYSVVEWKGGMERHHVLTVLVVDSQVRSSGLNTLFLASGLATVLECHFCVIYIRQGDANRLARARKEKRNSINREDAANNCHRCLQARPSNTSFDVCLPPFLSPHTVILSLAPQQSLSLTLRHSLSLSPPRSFSLHAPSSVTIGVSQPSHKPSVGAQHEPTWYIDD